MSETTTKAKIFDRAVFEKVKEMQNRKRPATREQIMQRTGFGKETIRKAMKAGNWPSYRKSEKNAARARKARLMDDFAGIYSDQNNTDPNFLLSPDEGKLSKGWKPVTEKMRTYAIEAAKWIAVALVLSLVIFLVLKL